MQVFSESGGKLLAVAACLGLCGSAIACVQPDPPMDPPPSSWWAWGSTPGVDTLYVSLGTVFQSDTHHNCACGIGLGSTANPLPAGVEIHGVRVGVLDKTTHTFDPIVQFDQLGPNPGASPLWGQGPVPPNPELGGPAQGSTWFGFGGVIDPVNPPVLGPGQCFVICFDFWIDPGIDWLIEAQIGGGLGDPNNGPLFDPSNPHSSRYSPSFTIRLPSPGAMATLGLGLAVVGRRRR